MKIFKKIIVLVTCVLFCFVYIACGKEDVDDIEVENEIVELEKTIPYELHINDMVLEFQVTAIHYFSPSTTSGCCYVRYYTVDNYVIYFESAGITIKKTDDYEYDHGAIASFKNGYMIPKNFESIMQDKIK